MGALNRLEGTVSFWFLDQVVWFLNVFVLVFFGAVFSSFFGGLQNTDRTPRFLPSRPYCLGCEGSEYSLPKLNFYWDLGRGKGVALADANIGAMRVVYLEDWCHWRLLFLANLS